LSIGHLQNKLDDNSVERAMDEIRRAINHVHENKSSSDLSFQYLYIRAYNLVVNKNGAMLYSRVEGLIKAHLDSVGARVEVRVCCFGAR
jgi:hypothetical protein